MNKKSKIQMTIRILLALFAAFTIGNVISMQYAKKKILEEADMLATRDMDKMLLSTDAILDECEISAHNLHELIDDNDIHTDSLYSVMERFLKVNPHLYGAAVAFDPTQIQKSKIVTPAIFIYGNEQDGFHRIRIDSVYSYTNDSLKNSDWFCKTRKTGQANWGHPMYASDKTVIAPYCMPLYTSKKEFLGVLAVDIKLAELSKDLLSAAPYPDAMVTLMDQSLNFVVHPKADYVLSMSLDSLINRANVKPEESILSDMHNGIRGSNLYGSGQHEHIIYYAPVEKAKWTLAIDCPSRDIYTHVDDVKHSMLLNLIVGMLIFSLVCYKLFKRVDQYETIAATKAAMQGELRIAAAIQKGMLPKLYPAFPDVKEIDVYGTLIPAKEVGGDLFDYFVRDDKFFFCIGDVSGKGVPASLFMAVLRSLFRNVSLHVDSPATIANALNTALSEGNEQNMFCTMFIGVLDIKSGHLKFCNCGHNAPVIRQLNDNGSYTIAYGKPKTNIAVGIIDSFPFEEEETDMKPSEAIFLYTDGVTEAESQNKELYGEDRLLKALGNARKHDQATAKEVAEEIYADVERFAEPDYQSDDITMVVIEYRGPQQ